MGSVNILLSYRRADASGMAGRIFDRLSQHYGPDRVFIDIDSIPMGVDFQDHLEAALADCGVLLALIGPKWIGRRPGKPARIHDEDDWVRVEVEKAFAFGVPVIPVLLEGATLPKKDSLPASLQPLLRRNGVSIDSGRDFHAHLSRLCNGIDGLLASFNRGAARQADCDGLEEMPTVGSMDPASAPVAPAASTDKPEGAHDNADGKRASSLGSSSGDDVPAGATAETDTSGTVNDAERAAPKPTQRALSRRFNFSAWYDQKERGARWRAVWGSSTALLVLFGLVGTWLAARTGEFGSAQTAPETSGGVASNAPTQASVTSTPSEPPAPIGKAPESTKPKETSVPPPTPESSPIKENTQPNRFELADPGTCRIGGYIVFFDWGRTEIRPEAQAILDNFVGQWRDCRAPRIFLAAHTDGSFSPADAARAVKGYLVLKGIPGAIVNSRSFGSATADQETHEAQNRRVEITAG